MSMGPARPHTVEASQRNHRMKLNATETQLPFTTHRFQHHQEQQYQELTKPSPPKKVPAKPFELGTDRRRRARLAHLKKELEAADTHLKQQQDNYKGWVEATQRIEDQQRQNYSGLLDEMKDMQRKREDSSHCRFSMDGVERFSNTLGRPEAKGFVVSKPQQSTMFPPVEPAGPSSPTHLTTSQAEFKKTFAPPRGMSIYARSQSIREDHTSATTTATPKRKQSTVLPKVASPQAQTRNEILREQERKRQKEEEAEKERKAKAKIDYTKEPKEQPVHTKSFLLRKDHNENQISLSPNPDASLNQPRSPGTNWAWLDTSEIRRMSMSGGAGGMASSGNLKGSGRRGSISPSSNRRGSGSSTGGKRASVSPGWQSVQAHVQDGSLNQEQEEGESSSPSKSGSTRKRRGSTSVNFVLEGVETVSVTATAEENDPLGNAGTSPSKNQEGRTTSASSFFSTVDDSERGQLLSQSDTAAKDESEDAPNLNETVAGPPMLNETVSFERKEE